LHLVGVLPEALSANTLLGNATFPLEPVNRHACIELRVVVSLKRQPATVLFIGLSEVNALHSLAMSGTYHREKQRVDFDLLVVLRVDVGAFLRFTELAL
jgi:hypothetical protein